MTWNLETDVFSLIILVTMIFDMRNKQFNTRRQDQTFRLLTFFTATGIILDILASVAIDYPVNICFFHIANTAYFAFTPLLPVAWYYYISIVISPEPSKFQKTIDSLAGIPYAAYFAIAISTPFTGLIYSAGEDLSYKRGPLFFIMVLIFVLYTVFVFIRELTNISRITPRSRFWILFNAPLIISCGIAVQLTLTGVLAIFPAYTVVLLMVYFNIQSRRTLLDGLTGINSRVTGENKIKEYLKTYPSKKAAFIITDIDSFKRVNDTLGHLFGDSVLTAYAKVLLRCFPPESIITRYGGDEFVVFVPEYENRDVLTGYMEEVLQKIGEAFTLDEEVTGMSRITVSMGVALKPDNGLDYISLYENSDAALYYAKSSQSIENGAMFQPNKKIAYFGGKYDHSHLH